MMAVMMVVVMSQVYLSIYLRTSENEWQKKRAGDKSDPLIERKSKQDYFKSNRSSLITLVHAEAKSFTNLRFPSFAA